MNHANQITDSLQPNVAKEAALLKASQSMTKIINALSEIELIMRSPDPNKLQLAVIRANCIDIDAHLADVSYWAIKKYRKEF